MQLACSAALVLSSEDMSLDVAARSPSASALAAPLAPRPFLASLRSVLPFLISSFRFCSRTWKFCKLEVSAFLRPSSCALALSSKSSSVAMMPPSCCRPMPSAWPWYTSASGAPRSPSSSPDFCMSWRSAVSLPASLELSNEACTMAFSASTTLAPLTCSIEAEPILAISRSRMAMARFSVSITSTSSFSSAAKSACSLARISVAAFRSAVSSASSAANSSIFVLKPSMLEPSLAMVAFRLAISPEAVLIEKPNDLALSSHHSENSAKTLCDSSPSPMTFASRSPSISMTFPMGLACTAAACAEAAARAKVTSFMPAICDAFVARAEQL
mmetsp:Transcript_46746/g.121306  ORF Transcript_46746/g.121306 Transcript_46746/m.121306 type:complete len:329 (-) Transcript_46746:11-997(-)